MHTHTLLLFSFFFLCATQHLVSSKSFFSSNKNRRILNEPSLPPSQPPNQPPLSPPILPSTSSTPNLKHPFSTTTTTTNPSPFFPFYPYPSPPPPPPPPPPSFSTFAYFPANISSLVLPQSPKTKSSSHKPLSIAITAVACVTAIAAVSAFIYCRRNNASAGNKTSSSETSTDVFPPNSETANGTRKERHASSTSSECLYLGTVIHSRGIDDAPDIRKMDSPELQPIPRLAPRLLQHSQPPQARVVASSTQASEEHEEFYSPRGSSLGSDENGLDELSSISYSSPSENNDNKIFHEPNGALRISNASRNEDALSRRLSSASNGSRKSISPSCSAFSLPSSPEKAMHFGNLDQSPRMSSFSDRFKQPGLSSLSLSPTLLSSPETEWRNKTSNESSKFPNFVPHRNINNVLDQIATHPPIGPFNRVSPPPPPQPPPPPPPPLQPQKKHWEVPTSMPPELIPPSRPFVLQNQTTKVSPVVELMQSSQSFRENEKNMKPKLKPLYWDKVRARSGHEMVWDHLKSSSFKLNEETIETLFVVKPKVNTQHSVLPQPSQEERILDPKKSQNIAILLRALNVTVEEVCEALLEGNADTLGTELLESLLKMAPSEEEERKLKEYKDDSPTKLGPAEKFLKAVLDVPFAFKRVEAMHYVVNFESEVEYLRKSFQILEAASEELRNCRMFSKLLEAVLKTGNRMNVGTIRGEAQAFKLDTLLKLADVKGADGKTTLLHFVVQEIIRTEGARLSGTNQTPISTLNEDAKCRRLGLQVVSSLSSELANVKKAAAMDSEILSSDVSKLTKGIACIAEVAKTNEMEGSDESCQKFTESMNKFIRMAEEEIPKIEAQERVALTLVKGITEYFHGNLAKEEAHPFRIFMVVRDFLTVLDRVCREVGMINERTMVSSAHKFPVPVNPKLPQTLPGLTGRQQYQSSDDSESSP